ncbi:MAG: hypothetical protein ACE5MK_10880 [Acidobacteriota bacterium]
MKYVLEELLPYIALLYLIDCVAHIKRHHVFFVSHFRRGFKLKEAGFHLIGLSPIDQAVMSHKLPVCLTKSGLYIFAGERRYETGLYDIEDSKFMAYQDMKDVVAVGEDIKINDVHFMATPSAITAKYIAGLIHELKSLQSIQRWQRIQNTLAEAMDLRAIQSVRKRHQNLFVYVEALSSLLFACTFIILPLTLYSRVEAYINFQFLFASMAVIYLSIVVVTFFAHRKMYGAEVAARMYSLLSVILLPPSAMHILNSLTRNIYARFDYLAVAASLVPSDAFKYLVRRELRRIAYVKARGKDDELKEFWSLREKSLHGLLVHAEISLEELLAVPEKKDQSAANYCPLCLTEFRAGFTECSDCGVELKEFE